MNTDELLKILACPKCHGDLRLVNNQENEGFACDICQAVYPIREDIPIMLIGEAIPFDQWPVECKAGV